MVQWLRLRASTARGTGSIPGRGTKIPHAASTAKHHHQQQQQKIRMVRVIITTNIASATTPIYVEFSLGQALCKVFHLHLVM